MVPWCVGVSDPFKIHFLRTKTSVSIYEVTETRFCFTTALLALQTRQETGQSRQNVSGLASHPLSPDQERGGKRGDKGKASGAPRSALALDVNSELLSKARHFALERRVNALERARKAANGR